MAKVSQKLVDRCDNLSAVGELCPLWPFLCPRRKGPLRAAEGRDEPTPHLHHFNDLVSAAASGLD
jgi:hypothetical protein